MNLMLKIIENFFQAIRLKDENLDPVLIRTVKKSIGELDALMKRSLKQQYFQFDSDRI